MKAYRSVTGFLAILEPLAFFIAVMSAIWLFRSVRLVAVGALAVWVVASWVLHRRSASAFGFSWRMTAECVAQWRPLWIVLLILFVLANFRNLASGTGISRGIGYLLWCVVQQTVYQSMVSEPLRCTIKREIVPAVAAGALFALAHLPNPVLVPLTFVWGICSSLLFYRCPSVPMLGGLQFLLSGIAIAVSPASLHHGFRIGPSYWRILM